MSALASHRLTVKEYLELDRAAERKSEYHDGELFPIVAVTLNHARLHGRVFQALDARLRTVSCFASVANRVRVSPSQFLYPDVTAICGQPEYTDEQVDTITNPKVIVEVLSPSPADYDHGGKFALYRELASLEEYVLVSQDQIEVEVYRKQSQTWWTLEILRGPEAIVRLKSVPVEFPLSELYEGILEV
ncbi:MAG: Uma2 family endonuclease [Bryobacterales bacterium]|nr:Uma2 family endonuclease [Bryobacterales bacterium]